MPLIINGQPRESAAETLVELLNELQLEPQHVAVELNQVIVAREMFATTQLKENDHLEIIQFVGGG